MTGKPTLSSQKPSIPLLPCAVTSPPPSFSLTSLSTPSSHRIAFSSIPPSTHLRHSHPNRHLQVQLPLVHAPQRPGLHKRRAGGQRREDSWRNLNLNDETKMRVARQERGRPLMREAREGVGVGGGRHWRVGTACRRDKEAWRACLARRGGEGHVAST